MTKRTGTMAVAAATFILGGIAAQFVPRLYAQDTPVKGPKWQYGLSVMARGAAEQNFSGQTKKYGLEVYRDENNGNLIYISETGSIAVVPAK